MTRSEEAAKKLKDAAVSCTKCGVKLSPLMVMHKPDTATTEKVMEFAQDVMLILICASCGQSHGATLKAAIIDQNQVMRGDR